MMLRSILFFLVTLPATCSAQDMYTYPSGTATRWLSFENRPGSKGKAAMENKGAKGNASQWVKPGDSITLADYEGAGTINRIWMTIIDRNPACIAVDVHQHVLGPFAKAGGVCSFGRFFWNRSWPQNSLSKCLVHRSRRKIFQLLYTDAF